MGSRAGRTVAGIGLAAVAIGALAMVAIPAWVIYPFRPQTSSGLGLSYGLKGTAPIATLVALVLAATLAAGLWSRARRLARAGALAAVAVTGLAAWFARQNHFEWMFHPILAPRFAPAASARWVRPDDRVLAVSRGDDAVAYPIRLMAYHHLLQDIVGGTPVVVTY
jgi:hypothetical protein